MPATRSKKQQHSSPKGKPAMLPVGKLLLDAENPRLASGEGGDTQTELLKVLWQQMDVVEVALSIAANGYFREEPLLVIPGDSSKPKEKGKHIVLEGNRRLGAVLLLRDEKLRKQIKATDLPDINAERRAGLDKIPVSIYAGREELWTYCGFRHINGTQPWDPFSKAKYVATVHDKYKVDLAEIASRIGDRHATVKRLYRGYEVLRQAEKHADFDREDRVKSRFYFSHLYTALDQVEFQKFLGIASGTSLRANPVPKSKLGNLNEVMTWIYGKKSANIEPVVRTQSPDLNRLREVISKPASLAALRAGYQLSTAYQISIGDKRRFRHALTTAKEELQQAKGTLTTGYAGEDDLFETVGDIVLLADKIKEEMESKRSEKKISGGGKK
ncbi:MAG: hypothetical protein HQ592_00930 [Planctomycetes bacterium]|nr:hypothetical protein [Planctomycetota bacterium]